MINRLDVLEELLNISGVQNIFDKLDRGVVMFGVGDLYFLGLMEKQGLIQVDLYLEGYAIVRKFNI